MYVGSEVSGDLLKVLSQGYGLFTAYAHLNYWIQIYF